MNSINYSIIIPHKNNPNLLKRCIESIPRREDIQIIIIDDNSDSQLVDFNNFPGLNEQFVEVYFSKEGKGAGYARNIGIKHAKGKWLLFADADDYYVDNFISTLDKFITSDYDIIYYKVIAETNGITDRSIQTNTIRDLFLQHKISIDEIKYLNWAPWNKMFSKDLIDKHKIVFDEIPVGNDAFFSFIAGEKSLKPMVIHNKLYCITHNPNSITFTKRTFNNEFDRLQIDLRINSFLRKHNLSKYQIPVLSFTTTFKFIKKYGIKYSLQYIHYIYINDSICRYLFLYAKNKICSFF